MAALRKAIDIEDFTSQLRHLLVESFSSLEGRIVHPLNLQAVQQDVLAKLTEEKDAEREVYRSLVDVAKAIERDGGINREVYESNHAAINSRARDLTDQRWWGSGNAAQHYAREDQEAKIASDDVLSRFPNDGGFDAATHGNIFDAEGRHSVREGTLFSVVFETGLLTNYRILHQGHRDRVKVATVDIPSLKADIGKFVSHFIDEVKLDTPELPSDADYRAAIQAFNKEYGKIFSLVADHQVVELVFNENPGQLAGNLRRYAWASGPRVVVGDGPSGPYIFHDMEFLDLLLHRQLPSTNSRIPFDPRVDSLERAYIIPRQQNILLPLLVAYAIHKTAHF